jgi:tRNA(adenine34) deaminase
VLQKDSQWMNVALKLAKTNLLMDEVPVAAIIVCDEQIIGQGLNKNFHSHQVHDHAEILAINDAVAHLKKNNLKECTLYVTLEPCLMCTGAIVHSKIGRVVFAAYDEKGGAMNSSLSLNKIPNLNHYPVIHGGVCAEASADLLKRFFKEKRDEQ